MKIVTLARLMAAVPGSRSAVDSQTAVVGLQDDSRRVKPGDLFFAVPGSKGDGLAYAGQAVMQGAVAVVAARDPGPGIPWLQVLDVADARHRMAEEFHGYPAGSLRFHGITGTSGKTTTAFLLEAMLAAAERSPALLGTVVQRYAGYQEQSELTTPGTLALQAFLSGARLAGCSDVVMEVSSHSLDQARVKGIRYETALFTNLTRDHLDYHGDMDAYHAAKALLFTRYLDPQGAAVIHLGGAGGERMADTARAAGSHVVTAALRISADVQATEVVHAADGVELLVPALGGDRLRSSLFGEFNAENLILATAAALQMGISPAAIRSGAMTARVPGRFEMAFNDGHRRVVVDYAHKPDALERVLLAARGVCKGRLLCVFGCGGDRDQGKRPMMAAIATRIADRTWLTSDNPRTEDPQVILQQVAAGVLPGSDYRSEIDRRNAIHLACADMQSGDWLVVAGKGHEDYQIVGTTKHHFDDREVVREAMQKC